MSHTQLLVSAGILVRNNQVLVAKRPIGKHLAGYWEFPGGKMEIGETAAQCLKREWWEELGITIRVGKLALSHTHQYPDRTVQLLTHWVYSEDLPRPLEHDRLAWALPRELAKMKLSPADTALIPIIAGRLGHGKENT